MAACAVAGFVCEEYFSEVAEDAVVLENVESLSDGEIGLYYRVVTGECPSPVNYKRWARCEDGGTQIYCMPSDC